MSVQELITFKNDFKENQLVCKVKNIIIAKIKEIEGDISKYKLHPEITYLTLELVYNLTNEFKLKVDRDKLTYDILVVLFNLNPNEQIQLNSQISYFVKNNKIKVIGSFKKFGINMINCIKKKIGL